MTVPGTLTDARKERARLQLAGRPEQAADAAGAVTLRDHTAEFFRARAGLLTPATIALYDLQYRKRIDPTLGALALSDLTPDRLEAWWASVREASSWTVARHSLVALRAIVAAAVEWQRVPVNHAARLRLPPRGTSDAAPVERALSTRQLRRLFTDGTTCLRIETMLRMAGEAGLRRGELIGLRWTDIDFAERRVTVRRSVWHRTVKDAPPVVVVKTTKGRRARSVPITKTLARLLGEFYAEAVVAGGDPADGYVWTGKGGEAMGKDSASQATKRALVRAGLIDERGRPITSLHGLRHTAGSVMLSTGVALIVVSRVLGHADVQVTARVYSHLTEDRQIDAAATALERAVNARTVRGTVRERGRDVRSPKGKPVSRG